MTIRSAFMIAVFTTALASPAMTATGSGKDDKEVGLAAAILAARHAQYETDPSAATGYLERALELDPTNSDLLRDSYFIAAQAGDFAVAVPSAKRFMSVTQSQRSSAPLVIAVDYYKKGEFDKAWAAIENISGQGPVASGLPMIRAWAQAPITSADTVLSELAPYQVRDATSEIFHLMSGMLNEFYGRNEDALIHYDAMLVRGERLSLSTVRLLAAGFHRLKQPDKLNALLQLYRQNQVGSFDTDDFLKAFADPKYAPAKMTPADGMAEALFLTAQTMLQGSTNSFSSQIALVYGQMALYLNPDLDIARWIIGATAAGRSAYDQSNKILEGIGRNDPGYIAAQLQIADNLERQGKKGDALGKLQALAKLRSDLPEAQISIGDLLRRDEKFAEAVAAYDRAFKLYPNGDPANWILYYTRGIALERSKNWTRAEADFKRALELNPDDPSVLNYLGYSWLDRNENLAEARRLIEAAYQKRPDEGSIVDSLGWVMYMTGEYDKAVVQLEKAVELNPSDPTINEHLGDAYWKVGRRNEARFQWRRALSLAEEESQKTAIRTKLDQGLAQN
ncbi:MAG: tetratricopeptide repeat protein [Rhodobacteraceae bacterium]|nr:tetratricopeptide repeat protein [Paracoccaceae bacterium]